MNLPKNGFYDRKLEHIKRDYDHVFSTILKVSDHGNSVRQWNIAVIVAYLGLIKACVDKGTEISLVPLIGAIYLFWVMEAFVKAQMYLYREYTLDQADCLFSEKDDACFRQLVEKYKLLSKDKESPGKNWWGNRGRLHRFFRGLVNCQTFVFYILPLAILIGWSCASRAQFTFSVLLLPAFLFLVGGSIYWWKYPKLAGDTSGQGTGAPL